MKDYYYILGIKQTATAEEVKKAYRKLSMKFHPDKNDGDEFFTERFKEIQEAYETLIDSSKRIKYDDIKTSSSSTRQNSNGTNFNPEIEFFKSNKQSFEYDEELTFSWKTINADKVILKPFGPVQPIGQKTYKIKDFKNTYFTIELIAENSSIGRQTKTSLTIANKTYTDLYGHFKEVFRKEVETRKFNKTSSKALFDENNGFSLTNKQIKIIIGVGIFVILLLLLFGQ